MIIDTHLHERTFSGDSRMNLLELVSEARRKGLDGICITDHDQMGLTQYAAKIAEQENYPIFVGVEYLACEGDIVAFGIDRLPEPHLMAQEFIDYVTARGGICISAHPYRANSRSTAAPRPLRTVRLWIPASRQASSSSAPALPTARCRSAFTPLKYKDISPPYPNLWRP